MSYKKHRKEVLQELNTNQNTGLTKVEAEKRLEQYGQNTFHSEEKVQPLKVFLHTLREPIVIVLWIAIALSIASAVYDIYVNHDMSHAMSAIYETLAILAIILINSFVTFYQTLQAKKSLDSLKKLVDHHSMVLRDGDWHSLNVTELVPGDIVKFKMGDFIEADLRILSANELQLNESHLTGESDPIQKTKAALPSETDLGDQTNMAFSGSTVMNGSGLGVVVATGMDTELGKIAGMLQTTPIAPTPIEKTIKNLTKTLMYVAAAIVAVVLIYGIAKEYINYGAITVEAVMANISSAIAVAVASIPDAMPVVLSIVLTIGAGILARNNGLIKSLNSVETLGATTFIASDKTGTLTKNEMTVTNFYANGQTFEVSGQGYEPHGEISLVGATESATNEHNAVFQRFLTSALINNEASIQQSNDDGSYYPLGNPTDVSLVVLGAKADMTHAELISQAAPDFNIIRVLPFDSTRKMMSMVVQKDDEYFVYTKGAPDVLFQKATQAQINDEIVDFTSAADIYDHKLNEFADQALRTIAVAERQIDAALAKNGSVEELEQDFTILGIAGIIDPPRPEVKASIKKLHRAGVAVVMITGDHAATASAIALRLGIINKASAPAVTGAQLREMTDEQLLAKAKETRVYARVTPSDKQRIIEALQKNSEVVAMTGDGVNDAPALKAADIGIAMGINGTEVTKDSADLILLDDKFTTIEKSVEAGRQIFGNIRNFIRQELVTNVSEVLSLLLVTFFVTRPIGQVSELTPSLTAVMVLWVNMISDSLPSFSLGFDKSEKDSMLQKPRDMKEPILNKKMLKRVALRGFTMGFMVFLTFIWAAHNNYSPAQAQTAAFLMLVFGQLWHIFDARSERSIFARNPFSNKLLLLAVAFAGIASVLATYLPLFHKVMGTAQLPELVIVALLFISAVPTFVLSGIKELVTRRRSAVVQDRIK